MSISREELAEKIEGILADNFYLGEHGFNATQQAGIDKLLSLFDQQEKQIRYDTKKKMIARVREELNLDENDDKEFVTSSYVLGRLDNLHQRIVEGYNSLTTPKEEK